MSEIASAMPTKSFFIFTLVRDITVFDAILDLVDNSVDGAKRIRGNESFDGLLIDLNLQKDIFEITDNCGGIKAENAKNYAFRFGKTKDDEANKIIGSIGGFGVGMKRAIFKIGSYFEVDSVESSSSFSLKVDLKTWQLDEDNAKWTFDFDMWNVGQTYSESETYTKIKITGLHHDASSELSKSNIVQLLGNQIKKKHAESLEKGLLIKLNGQDVKKADALQLLTSNFIKPIYLNFPLLDGKIDVTLYAGISENNYTDCGWYISCNHRMVVEADKTENTGWVYSIQAEKEIISQENVTPETPKAHKQFARFRGFVWFNSDDATLLPWNTAKTGINYESEIFKKIKPEMIGAMRNIIDFLNALDSEHDFADKPLTTEVLKSRAIPLRQITEKTMKFEWREFASSRAPKEKLATISYKVKEEDASLAKELLGVDTNKELGIQTFQYFLEHEAE